MPSIRQNTEIQRAVPTGSTQGPNKVFGKNQMVMPCVDLLNRFTVHLQSFRLDLKTPFEVHKPRYIYFLWLICFF